MRFTPAIVVSPDIARRLAAGDLSKAERAEWGDDFNMLLHWRDHIHTEDDDEQGNGRSPREGAR